MAKKMNAFYAQSGGVTAVINASACGVIETARKHKDKIGKVYAGRNGIIGALTEDLIDTTRETDAVIAALRSTPSGAFGSCPGFGSVAKYIAVSTLEASYDVRSMAKTSTKVFVIEVMGRHAGWIAAAGGLVEDHGIPVVILFPGIGFDQKKLHARVAKPAKEH